ncbi:MAG: TauD/TfdA family dioxygenase [Rhodospirillaceae bacterium]
MSAFEVMPSGAALGADIQGVDLSVPLDNDTFDRIHKAWHDHLVLRIRGQALTDEQFIAFSRRFGNLDLAPVDGAKQFWIPEHPELTVISNVVDDGGARGSLGSYESLWHTDMSFVDLPPKASLLWAIEVPSSGGDTGFCNMYDAYDALPGKLKRKIRGLRCKHDASRNSVGQLRKGFEEAYTDPDSIPGAVHPLVRIHPGTKREALFLGRRRNAHIVDLPWAESQALLDELWDQATREEFTWYQQWLVGDVIIWDNRCVMHRRDALDPNQRRVMHRTQIGEDSPVLESA